MVKDPVCEMEVDEKTAGAKSQYKEKTYSFCSMSCKDQFEKNPEQYVKAS